MSGKTAAVAALAALLCAAWMGQAMATPDDNSGTGSDDSPTSFDPIDDIPGDITSTWQPQYPQDSQLRMGTTLPMARCKATHPSSLAPMLPQGVSIVDGLSFCATSNPSG